MMGKTRRLIIARACQRIGPECHGARGQVRFPAMPQRFTVTALVPRFLVQVASKIGVDVSDLLARYGVDAEQLRAPDSRVPHEFLAALWEELPRRSGDEAFGLRLAQRLPHGTYDVLDHMMSHAPCLGDCYRGFMRYQRLIHDAGSFSMEEQGSVVRLMHIWRGPGVLSRHINEFILASLLLRGRAYLREEWVPLEVYFQHARPDDIREHQRLFRAPLHFGHPINELRFERHLLDRRLPVADPTLGPVLDRFARLLLEQLPVQEQFLDQVRRAILQNLSTGIPEAEPLARQLGLSKRSFFRRLQEQGTSYQRLVDDLRRNLTLRHLQEGKLSLSEIAFLLGFSEVSTFHRAFRRWTGQRPAEYRRSLAGSLDAR